MNNPRSPILNPQSLLLALALAFVPMLLVVLPGCANVESLSVNGGYTPESGQVTGGVTIVFRDTPPAPALAAQLVDAGFTQSGPRTFRIVAAMRSMASDRATHAALDAVAVILPDRPAQPAPRPGATLAPPARHPQSAGVWVNSAAPVTPGAATPFHLCLSAPLRLCVETGAITAETQRRREPPKSPLLNPQSSILV